LACASKPEAEQRGEQQDAELTVVVAARPALPAPIKAAMLAMVRATCCLDPQTIPDTRQLNEKRL
jgi:hypothetical protein